MAIFLFFNFTNEFSNSKQILEPIFSPNNNVGEKTDLDYSEKIPIENLNKDLKNEIQKYSEYKNNLEKYIEHVEKVGERLDKLNELKENIEYLEEGDFHNGENFQDMDNDKKEDSFYNISRLNNFFTLFILIFLIIVILGVCFFFFKDKDFLETQLINLSKKKKYIDYTRDH